MTDLRLQAFIALHRGRIEAYFRGKVPPGEEEDLCQEALLALVAARDRLPSLDAPASYVLGVCRNLLCRYIRSKEKLPVHLAEEPADPKDASFERLRLTLALEKLTPEERALFEEYYVNLRTIAEISRLSKESEGTVKWRLWEIRAALKGSLGPR